MIRVFTYVGGQASWNGVELLPPPDQLPEMLWIDLEDPTPEEERRIFEGYFPLHTLTVEDITRPRRAPDQPPHFPKVEEFSDYLFVIVNPLRPQAATMVLDSGAPSTPALTHQLSAVLTHTMLITHHQQPLDAITSLRTYLQKHGTQAARGPDFLFHLILDEMVDDYAPLLDRVDDSLDQIEEQVFVRPTRRVLARLLGLKRNILSLRKTMIYERELLARLSRGEFALIDEREEVYYRNVYDHLIRFTELIEASREMVMDLMQTQLSSQANKLNEIMKVLTMISTIGLVCTLIAGVYGMNFEHMPELKWQYGYPFALGMMAAAAAGSFAFFRWRKWV